MPYQLTPPMSDGPFKVYRPVLGNIAYKVPAGAVFGKLTVAGLPFAVQAGKDNKAHVVCTCECGCALAVPASRLLSKDYTSCGCARGGKNKTHGESRTSRLYTTWLNMRARCTNSNQTLFCRYGGRGISVCADWAHYQKFKSWAIQSGYQDNLTIDRIDNNGNYCPENCQWITKSENSTKSNRERRTAKV